MRLGITGSSGFVGWHLRCLLLENLDVTISTANEEAFESPVRLQKFVSDCNVVIHLAGMNRGGKEEVLNTNVELAKALIRSCESTRSAPHIIFANSIQADNDTVYGRSKKKAWEIISNWATEIGGCSTNVILPNIFGEHGRPFYNSVVATFCYQLANHEEPNIIEDNVIQLIHVREVAEILMDIARREVSGDIRPRGELIAVSELLRRLVKLSHEYERGFVPDLSDDFNRKLFNTYRSFLFPSDYPRFPKLNKDERGNLFEAVKARSAGQSFVSRTKPDVTRGNHYHVGKFERFLVLGGKGLVRIRRLLYDDIYEFSLDGSFPGYIDIPTLHTHSITNVGNDDLVTLFWADEVFNPSKPDTYPEVV